MKHVVCYGDSNTWGFDAATLARHPWEVRWPGVLQRELGDDVRVHEEGLSGRTTMHDLPDQVARNGRTTLHVTLETHSPIDALVLALGVNDLFVPGLNARWAARGVGTLVEAIGASDAGPGGEAPPILVVVPPPIRSPLLPEWEADAPGAREESHRLAEAMGTVLRQLGVPWLDLDGVADVDPIDGLHFTAEAHAAIGVAVADALRPRLLPLRPSGPRPSPGTATPGS